MSGTESSSVSSHKSPLRRIFQLLQPDRSDILSVIVFSVLSGGLLLATPVAVQNLVNNVAFGATAPSIAIIAGLLCIGLVMGAVVVAVQTWIVEILQRRVFVRLVAELSERLRRIAWEVRDKHYNPELVNRFFDVVTIQKASSELLLGGIGTILAIVVGLVVIAFYHPLLLAMDAAIFLGIIVVFIIPARFGMRSAIRESYAKYAVAAWLEEVARHPLTFRTVGSERFVRQRSRSLAGDYIDKRRSHYRVVFAQTIAALGLQVLAGTAVLGLGGWLVVKGELTLGQLVAAELIVSIVVQSVAKLGKYAETYYDLVAAVDKVGHLTDLDVEAETTESLSRETPSNPARLELQRVALEGLGSDDHDTDSVVIEPSEMVAITGPNGVGKSYLLEMVYGLRRGLVGVLYDGTSLSDVSLGDFRREVALAAEDELLEETIIDNLVLGREGIQVEHAQEALRTVGLLDAVNELPDGMNTMLTPTGAPLSRGQASRLVIARCLLTRPRLLLIDRLIDDLSHTSRAHVIKALRKLSENCTIVIVTNDEPVAGSCDRRITLARPVEAAA